MEDLYRKGEIAFHETSIACEEFRMKSLTIKNPPRFYPGGLVMSWTFRLLANSYSSEALQGFKWKEFDIRGVKLLLAGTETAGAGEIDVV